MPNPPIQNSTGTAPAPRGSRDTLPFSVNLQRVNLGVGYTATLLPLAVWLPGHLIGTCAQNGGLDSISHYYYSPIGGDILVGALCLIGALLLFFFTIPDAARSVESVSEVDGYRRFLTRDLRLAQLAGAMSFVIALVPTSGAGCVLSGDTMRAFVVTPTGAGLFFDAPRTIENARIAFNLSAVTALPWAEKIHGLAAGVMFAILGYFSMFVFTRVQSVKSLTAAGHKGFKKKLRNAIYRLSGAVIFGVILVLLIKQATCTGDIECDFDRSNVTFWAEAVALVAFGISWLVKGRFIRWLADDPA